MKRSLAAGLLLVLAAGIAWGQSDVPTPANNFKKQVDVRYAVHDRVSLYGDLYKPTTGGPHPALLFIHGGGFLGGSKAAYAVSWGPYLAALVGVTQDLPQFANRYPQDPHASVSTKVRVAVPVYGVHDMAAWEKYDASTRNDRPMLDQYFGGPPEKLPGAYMEASPIRYVRQGAGTPGGGALNAATQPAWFVSWGEVDGVVPAEGQSIAFAGALRAAGANVTTLGVPGVGHWWFASSMLTGKQGVPVCPVTTPAKYECSGPTPNDYIAAKLLDFLAQNL